ncbi:MAG: hypothetical protein V4550_08180 [Gemmatimonadota bacterium]
MTINGTADAYNPYRRQYVDQKSMADKKAEMTVKGTKDGTFSKHLQDDHVWQFNIYRWLLARTLISDEQRAKFKAHGLPAIRGKHYPAPTELVMQGFSMMHIVRSGSTYEWSDGYGYKKVLTLYHIVMVLPDLGTTAGRWRSTAMSSRGTLRRVRYTPPTQLTGYTNRCNEAQLIEHCHAVPTMLR